NARVRDARGVSVERLKSSGRVQVACGVSVERGSTCGGIGMASCVPKERLITDGRVVGADRETEECVLTFRSVLVGIASVRGRRNCARRRQKPETGERDE